MMALVMALVLVLDLGVPQHISFIFRHSISKLHSTGAPGALARAAVTSQEKNPHAVQHSGRKLIKGCSGIQNRHQCTLVDLLSHHLDIVVEV